MIKYKVTKGSHRERYATLERLAICLDREWSHDLFDDPPEAFHHPSQPPDPRLWSAQDFYRNVIAFAKKHLHTTELLCYADIGAATGRMIFEWCRAFENTLEAVWVDPSEQFESWARMLLLDPGSLEQVPTVTDLEQVEYRTISELKKANFPTRDLPMLEERLRFCNVGAQQLPHGEHSFDVLTCLNVVDRHPNPKELVERLRYLLKPDGLLILASPMDWRESSTDRSHWVSDLSMLFAKDDWDIEDSYDDFYDIRHSNRLMVRHLSQVVAARKR